MSRLNSVKKTVSFTKYLTPDKSIPSIEVAERHPDALRQDRAVQGSFTWLKPEQRSPYKLRWVSPLALKDLDLSPEEAESDVFAAMAAGQHVFVDREAGLYPYSQNYAGYQFGVWAGQLGDGRAVSLFEITNPKTQVRWELQLKGAGLTPYSRFADGKAVLRSSIREALVSEALDVLGIPTTRALALVELPETFARRERVESCAIVTRMAQTWVRIGTFDLHHSRDNRAEVRKLAEYCITEVYKDEPRKAAHGDENRFYYLFRECSLRNARMIGLCQAYGFLNGVLNTDNTSIYGLSMDYGPFAFMDTFDDAFTPNHDDSENRYGFRSAPISMYWNCVKLGESLGELIGTGAACDDEQFIANGTSDKDKADVSKLATRLIMDMGKTFEKEYMSTCLDKLRERLGLLTARESDEHDLIELLLRTMSECELDYNEFFRRLGSIPFFSGKSPDAGVFLRSDRGMAPRKTEKEAREAIDDWLTTYAARLEEEKNVNDAERKARMDKVNPNFVLKNWVLQDVIEKAQKDDWSAFNAAQQMALHPFQDTYDTEYSKYLGESPKTERDVTCSCSS